MPDALTKKDYEISYEEIDKNIVGLVELLNEFDGIYTVGSCGGHADNKNYQMPEGEWMVVFSIEFNGTEVSTEGWFALEFLVWACNNNLRRNDYAINISSYAAPPYLNYPGNAISFTLEGKGISPDVIVEELKELKADCYISFEDYQNESDSDEDE